MMKVRLTKIRLHFILHPSAFILFFLVFFFGRVGLVAGGVVVVITAARLARGARLGSPVCCIIPPLCHLRSLPEKLPRVLLRAARPSVLIITPRAPEAHTRGLLMRVRTLRRASASVCVVAALLFQQSFARQQQ